MSTLSEKVFRSIMTDDEWQRHQGHEANYKENCEKFAAMTDQELAESAEYYFKNCQCIPWPRGSPTYDAVIMHNIFPELIKRLKGKD